MKRKNRAYRRRHREEIKSREKATYQRDREKKIAYQKKHRLEHVEEVRAKQRIYRKKHSKKIKAQNRASYLKHREKNRTKARAKQTKMRAALKSIEAAAGAVAAGKLVPKRSGPQPAHYESTESFRIGKRVEDCIHQCFKSLCRDLVSLPKRTRSNPAKAFSSLPSSGYSLAEVEAATRAPSNSLRSARWFVSIDTHLGYDTVAQYHKEFRAAYPES